MRGKTGTRREFSPWWSRDDGINRPQLPTDHAARERIVAQQREAVKLWREIVMLADEIHFPDAATGDYVRVSSCYGLDLYRIYQAFIELNVVGVNGDRVRIRSLLADYDAAWADYRRLAAEHPCCATLHQENGARYGWGDGADPVIREFRSTLAGESER